MRVHRVIGLSLVALASSACFGLTIGPGDGSGEASSTGEGEPRVMLQGGNAFGECAGACRFELTFGQDSAQLLVSDVDPSQPTTHNYGDFTVAGLAQVDGVEESLAMASLLDVYGCPDCDDGGMSWVLLRQAGLSTTHQYEFGNPPVELLEYDALVQELVSALRTCQASELIEPGEGCEPMTP